MYQKDKLEQIRDKAWCYPSTFSFLLSGKCNHNCLGCCAAEIKTDAFFPKERVPELIEDLKKMGTKNIEFCGGGEPLTHSDFAEIVKMFHQEGFHLGLITNGSLLSKGIVDEVGHCFNWIRVSLDASDAKVHNKIHRSNDFDKIIENIKYLVSRNKENGNKTNISIRYLLYTFNIHQMISMYDLAERLGANAINFRSARNCDDQVTPSQAERYTKVLEMLKEENGSIDVFGSLKKSYLTTPQCWLHWLWLIVDHMGNVYLCCWFQTRIKEHIVGNVFENRLTDIYSGERYREVAKHIDLKKCNLYDCRYHKYNEIYKEWLDERDTVLFI
jgi:MoaA/NifB/PqqE/SkfB family radical SAM enzyme